VAVLEDPVPKDNLDWYVMLRQQLQVPIAMHLGSGRAVYDAVRRGAVDMLNISPYSMVDFVRDDDLIVNPIVIRDGYADVPDAPGLGVELDEVLWRNTKSPAEELVLPGEFRRHAKMVLRAVGLTEFLEGDAQVVVRGAILR
jgi:L-alanine-DL-glutamate epimerase-like enolase superfamily enzyme